MIGVAVAGVVILLALTVLVALLLPYTKERLREKRYELNSPDLGVTGNNKHILSSNEN